MNTTLIWSDNDIVSKEPGLRELVEGSGAGYLLTWMNHRLYTVIKPFKTVTTEKIRQTAGSIARELSTRKIDSAHLNIRSLEEAASGVDKDQAASAFVEGWHLGSYQFLTYKSEGKVFRTKLDLQGIAQDSQPLHEGYLRAEAVSFARDLMNELPNVLNPETFPELLKKELGSKQTKVKIYRRAELEKMEMHGVLAVNRGSKYEPSFAEISYEGDSSKPLVALVGKGVTFDTGGISLKKGRDISDMRMDMGGAAAVAGTMKLLQSIEAKVNVTALIPFVENMPDSQSLLPSEVIRYKNGTTVQVGNTDAEGRLILADGLIRAGEIGAKYVVDIATLTGAVESALGTQVAGVFGDEALGMKMKEVGYENGDNIWPLPLVDEYDSYLDSSYADLCNISSKGEAGAITAALFLRRFAPENAAWLHVDMAGVMERKSASGYYPKSATGYGVRLLADYVTAISK